jgi:hypothetical protein
MNSSNSVFVAVETLFVPASFGMIQKELAKALTNASLNSLTHRCLIDRFRFVAVNTNRANGSGSPR